MTVLRAADGRVPGRRGLATRQRLLDTAAVLLATTSYRDLNVTDITRKAGTSPATFYQYFDDIEAVVLAVADETADRGAELAHLIEGQPWKGAAGWRSAHGLVDDFLDFWLANQPVLRVMNLLTEEGDERFRVARVRMLNAVTRALATAIEDTRGRRSEKDDVDPMAMAGALVAMVAHVAAHQDGFDAWQISMGQVREAMARLVYSGVIGPKMPKR